MTELYLSRLMLNPRHHLVQRDLADCRLLHQRVLSFFPNTDASSPREAFGILYRLEIEPQAGIPSLLVQSRLTPDWSLLPAVGYLAEGGGGGSPGTKEISASYAAVASDARFRFRLRANPTRKIDTKSGPDGVRRNGKRVEFFRDEDQLAWLERKAEQSGFTILAVRVDKGDALGTKQTGGTRRESSHPLTFGVALFNGVLRVTDVERFQQTLVSGIGSGKAFGFGLLSIAPARDAEE